MAINVTLEENKPIPEGLYKATISEIEEDEGEHGPYLKFIFEIADGEHAGVLRSEIASKKLSHSPNGKSSKLYQMIKPLVNKMPKPGEELDIESLLGRECQILLKDAKEKDGIVFQSVKEVMPV